MSDLYLGDSDPKRIARLDFWETCRRVLGPRFFRMRLVGLASQEAGDAQTLLGLGVSPRNIILFEMRREAAEQARARVPQVQIVHGDIGQAARYGAQIGVAFFDFCGHPTDEKLATVKNVMGAMSDGAIVAWEFARGREQGRLAEALREMKKRLRQQIQDTAPATTRTVLYFHNDGSVVAHEQNPLKWQLAEVDGRNAYVLHRLHSFGCRNRCLTVGIKQWRYRGHQTPMFISARQIYRNRGPLRAYIHNWAQRVAAAPRRIMTLPNKISPAHMAYILATLDHSDSPSLALNSSTGRIGALRAHFSRGTYGTLADCAAIVVGGAVVPSCDAEILIRNLLVPYQQITGQPHSVLSVDRMTLDQLLAHVRPGPISAAA